MQQNWTAWNGPPLLMVSIRHHLILWVKRGISKYRKRHLIQQHWRRQGNMSRGLWREVREEHVSQALCDRLQSEPFGQKIEKKGPWDLTSWQDVTSPSTRCQSSWKEKQASRSIKPSLHTQIPIICLLLTLNLSGLIALE